MLCNHKTATLYQNCAFSGGKLVQVYGGPVSNAIKKFTSLNLQVCKYRANFDIILKHKYCLIPYVNAYFHF